MSRRTSLPGADELFRPTGDDEPATTGPARGAAQQLLAEPVPGRVFGQAAPDARDAGPDARLPEAAGPGSVAGEPVDGWPTAQVTDAREAAAPGSAPRCTRRRVVADAERRPSGRERHDEKITVYLSPEELMDLERARLTLRGDHAMAVDRGRIVREALAVVLADLDDKGESSILVRRLRGL